MKKTILAIMIAFGLVACGDITGDTTNNDNSDQVIDNSYTFIEGDRDYGSGTPLFCNDSNCSVERTTDNSDSSSGSDSETSDEENIDAVVGEYSAGYNQTECQAAGFFYCTIDDICTNQRIDDSSSTCTRNK